MTTRRRIAAGAAGALMLGLMSMLAAEATCTIIPRPLPNGGIILSVCTLEGVEHGEPYQGRQGHPARVWVYEYDTITGSSWTDVSVYQNRRNYPAGPQEQSETLIDVTQYQHLQPIQQEAFTRVEFGQRRFWEPPTPEQRQSSVGVTTLTSGALGTARVSVEVEQYRNDGRCLQRGEVSAEANSSSTTAPIGEHDCPVELPLVRSIP